MSSEVEREEYDVIIIGGGIGGLYTAWRLGTSTDLKVLVLESSDRFGGRFMSCEMPGGFFADLGGMRYVHVCLRVRCIQRQCSCGMIRHTTIHCIVADCLQPIIITSQKYI